jgi:hypothetical protein
MTHCPNCQSLLPDPPERFCPNCGADLLATPGADPGLPPPPPSPIDRTMPRTSPGSGWAPAGGEREGTPWERRGTIGFLSGLIETTQQVLTAPAAFFKSMPVTGGIGSPLLYALILGYAGIVVSAIYEFVLTTVTGSALGSLGSLGAGNESMAQLAPFIQGSVGLAFKLILGPVFLAVGLFLTAGIIHLGLMALGGAARGFEATFRVLCYAEATSVLQVIPICGAIVGSVYMLVIAIVGLSEAHGTTRGKAAMAVLLPIVLCCCCIVGPLVALFASIASRAVQ